MNNTDIARRLTRIAKAVIGAVPATIQKYHNLSEQIFELEDDLDRGAMMFTNQQLTKKQAQLQKLRARMEKLEEAIAVSPALQEAYGDFYGVEYDG